MSKPDLKILPGSQMPTIQPPRYPATACHGGWNKLWISGCSEHLVPAMGHSQGTGRRDKLSTLTILDTRLTQGGFL